MSRRTSAFASVMAVTLAGFLVAGFGTVRVGGQNAEHGRITRHALSCAATDPIADCFDEDTIDSLAGSLGDFGAVGAPDRGRGMLTSYAHCSGGDYLDVPGYPRSRSEAAAILTECRDYMMENMDHAVRDAADLLDSDGNIRSSQIPGFISCTYAGSEHGRAKCNILAHLGRILHAAQDFYSHSNWVDGADPARPIGADNPPGLGNSGRADWLDLRHDTPAFPEGLISGCFDNASFLGEQRGCLYDQDRAHRVRHLNLNKDTGQIDPVIGAGTTERGAIGTNFERAVLAAVEDSADKWATFRERLIATYGAQCAERMICAITHDDPTDDCP
ncbi:CinY protein [Parasphingopyxis sp. CP4]|uniref:CinY protein n=1 Tax=Parasphingopyxis sp. CP4 TaxID=2724527 RepID=UPI00159FCD06|nr:CinY protein [Parasphingopyxis sp. CP4]QLC23033.1 CinY protein [Parasphingopyxis sp. CP4]